MNNEVIATIRHPGFDNVNLTLPVDWRMDPFHSKSWQHNFMSLRWINPKSLRAHLLPLLRNFYHFHCVKGVSNPYYNTLRGDHTATIRLKQLVRFKAYYDDEGDIPGAGLCQRLIVHDLANLQQPAMYRNGHNHGLMMDIALLDMYDSDVRYRSKIDRDLVLNRGQQTLQTMYDENGLTREHSVSYQEHNFPIARDFLKHCPEAISKKKLEVNTTELLSFAMRDCGEYFPLGDSFRQPNYALLEGCPEINGFTEHCKTIGLIGNRIFVGAGLFFYKRAQAGWKDVHFASTCVWNSHNHKQDDELSFCLEVGGKLIFDDSGYTVYKNDLDLQLKNVDAHSTVEIEGHPFGDRRPPAADSLIESWKEDIDGFELIGRHCRVPEFVIRRSFNLTGNDLFIRDQLESSSVNDFSSKHHFILGPGIDVKVIDDKVLLKFEDKTIATLLVDETNGSWVESKQLYVGCDRFKYETTTKVSFVQKNQNTVLFRLQF